MKQKVKTFFHIFKNSLIPNSSYYKKIVKTHFSFSLKYFLVLILILNFLLIALSIIKFNPKQTKTFLSRIAKELEKYPPSLIIKINKGFVSSTLDYPYFFWGGYQNKRLWFVIDQSANPNSIIKYNSYFLLTKKELVIKPNFIDKKYNIINLNRINNLTISETTIKKIVKTIYFIQKNLILLYIISLPFVFIFFSISSLIISFFYLLIISFIVRQIFYHLFHRKIHFKKIFQLGLHSITTPLVLDYLIFIYPPKFSLIILTIKSFIIPFPIAFLILLFVFVIASVYEAYHNNK